MEINLLRAVKYRMFDELRYSVQRHSVYKDKMKVYHKFPYKERPQMGVVVQNAVGNRIKLSPDDHAATLKSHFALAHAEDHQGDNFIEWVWEDGTNLTAKKFDEDLSSQISGTANAGTNRLFKVSEKPIISGRNNTKIADNFRQLEIKINGEISHAEYVNGEEGIFMMPVAPSLGDTLTVSYWYKKITPPGRYYIELVSPTTYLIDPLYVVDSEKIIDNTTGTEIYAQLDNSNIFPDLDVLYTQKYESSNKLYLEKDVDYTLDTNGQITFLNALIPNTTLYANYRWIGDTLGPFTIPTDFHYDWESLPGVVLAFGNRREVGQKMVLIVYDKREPSAEVKSGHFDMSIDITVFTRDPIQLPDITDHIINDIWNNRRLDLMREGLTITEFSPGGESEDVYDASTGDLYYKHSITCNLMSEWKKFIPMLYEITDFNFLLYQRFKTVDYRVSYQGKLFELRLVPNQKPFEVKYPQVGYPRYF